MRKMKMKNQSFKLSRILFLVAAVLFFLPMTNYAQDHGHGGDAHQDHQIKHRVVHHVHHGNARVAPRHDDAYRDVVVNNRHLFYRGGHFYEKGPNGYVIATAPIGARIDVLPGGYRVIRRHGVRFFLFGGIYYQFDPVAHVYIVVNAPL